jgi:hypothetical protein
MRLATPSYLGQKDFYVNLATYEGKVGFAEGARAAQDGLPATANPYVYPDGTPLKCFVKVYNEWHRGWQSIAGPAARMVPEGC